MAEYDVIYNGGPCDGRRRTFDWRFIPDVLHCGGEVYNRGGFIAGAGYVFVWNAYKPVPIPSEVVGARDALRGFRHWMRTIVRSTERQVRASARARARIRRAVR